MENKELGGNAKSQCQRLLKRIEQGPITTFEARHNLDIVNVPARIFELRHMHGFNIQTCWSFGANPGGGRHRIARYVLFPGMYRKEEI